MINWKIRVRNPLFWAQVGVAIISPILVGLGLQWQDMTTWAALGQAIVRAIENPVIVLSIMVRYLNSIKEEEAEAIEE